MGVRMAAACVRPAGVAAGGPHRDGACGHPSRAGGASWAEASARTLARRLRRRRIAAVGPKWGHALAVRSAVLRRSLDAQWALEKQLGGSLHLAARVGESSWPGRLRRAVRAGRAQGAGGPVQLGAPRATTVAQGGARPHPRDRGRRLGVLPGAPLGGTRPGGGGAGGRPPPSTRRSRWTPHRTRCR